MKNTIYVIILLVFTSMSSLATERVLSTIGLNDIDAGGVYSRANMGTLFESNRFYVFYPGFHSGYEQRIKVRELKLKSDGTIEKHGMVDLNDIKFPGACTVFDSKIFVIAQDSENNDGSLKRMTFNGKNWSGSHDMPGGVKTKSGIALVELNNKLYCFYKYIDGSLRLTTTENGSDWSSHIEVKTAWLDAKHGTIAATTFIDNDKKSKIMLCFTNKENSIIFFQVVNEDGTNGRSFEYDTPVNNVTLVQGSTQGGRKGNIIQIIFSRWTHYKIWKVEYSVSENRFSGEEVLDWGKGNEEIIGDDSGYVPGTLFAFNSEDQDRKQKYIITFNARFYYGSYNEYYRDMKIYTWKSDLLIRDKNEPVVTDFDPVPSLCKMIGVIEGPPPYTSNDYAFGDWGPDGFFPPSSIEYGIAKTKSKENTSKINSEIGANISIGGVGGGFNYEVENSTSIKKSKTIINQLRIEPTENTGVGYKIFLKPIIHRKKYHLYDWSETDLDISFYTFSFDGPYVVYEPYRLSETDENLNPLDIYSYLDRDKDFESYDKIFDMHFEWRLGEGHEQHVSMTETKEHTSSSSEKIEVGLDEEFGDIFKIDAGYSYNIEYSLATTSSMEKDFTLSFRCPGLATDPDHIKGFEGKFYWILPTDNKDNWWVPDGYERDKPWLMTYDLSNITKHLGLVSDVNEFSNIFDNVPDLYPIPADKSIIISTGKADGNDRRIFVTDIMGNTLKTFTDKEIMNESINWDLSGDNGNTLQNGVYLLHLYSNKKSISKKFVIFR